MSRSKRLRPHEDDEPRFHNRRAIDFDPEDISDHGVESEEDSSSELSDAPNGREREHYIAVGKSKLRQQDEASLGPQYRGSVVRRQDALEGEEDSDDPFGRDGQDSISSSEGEVGVSSDPDEDGEDVDESSATSDDNDNDDASRDSDEDDEIDRDELRRIMAQERKTIAASISEAAKTDIEKGKAVKLQQKTFDSLLNVRIRLQKSLISSNSIMAVLSDEARLEPERADEEDPASGDDAVDAAEKAALGLWNALNELRINLLEHRTGSKRKRSAEPYGIETPSAQLWAEMQSHEAAERPNRRAVLDKWSARSRSATAALAASKGQINGGAASSKEQRLSDVLSAQLLDGDRLVRRTRLVRSCAPLQAQRGVHESEDVYDDADFYGVMLKELLERRGGEGDRSAHEFVATSSAPWKAAREEARTKKLVDTKASKGRKMRYTVHEKLQNFMAPEDRGTWGERQVNELFSSLFGKRLDLEEKARPGAGADSDDGDNDDDDHDGTRENHMDNDAMDVSREEQSLLLFRS